MIEFKIGESDAFERDAVKFIAKVDGTYVPCFISNEALESRFGAPPGSYLPTFRTNRSSIEAIAYDLIQKGRVENGELLITTKCFPSRG